MARRLSSHGCLQALYRKQDEEEVLAWQSFFHSRVPSGRAVGVVVPHLLSSEGGVSLAIR